MPISLLNNKVVKYIWKGVYKYDKDKYWRRREHVINPKSKLNPIIKFWYLYSIKKSDAYNNSSFGTNLNNGAQFASPPILPHGPNGIIIGHDTIIGKNATIYHQVTVMQGNVVIGDNVLLGAGAKVLPNVTIGNNVKVGANCVVVEDIPDNATVVLPKPRIITKD